MNGTENIAMVIGKGGNKLNCTWVQLNNNMRASVNTEQAQKQEKWIMQLRGCVYWIDSIIKIKCSTERRILPRPDRNRGSAPNVK